MVQINVTVWDQANSAPSCSRVPRRQVPAPPVAGDSPIALDGREATASIGTILLDAPPTQRYTPLMRRQRISMLLLLLLAAALASCSHQHEQPSLYRRFSLWRVRKRRAFQRLAHFSGVQYSLVRLLLTS